MRKTEIFVIIDETNRDVRYNQILVLTNPPLKLISVNIEKHRHIDRVLKFLKREGPDVVCLQEILEEDFPLFLSEMEMRGKYVPMTRVLPSFGGYTQKVVSGIATISKYPFSDEVHYYNGTEKFVPDFNKEDPGSYNRMLLVCVIEKNGKKFSVANTHFTWTHEGHIDDWQRRDIATLLHCLKKYPEIILCGDMNAPRGREIFNLLASNYKDNIPPEITTTIDKNLHRAGDLQYVVDVLFSTSKYIVENVGIKDGVSDHMAVVAEIRK